MYKELQQAWDELTAPGQLFEMRTIEVRGAPLREYVHAPANLRDFWASSAGHGDADYLVYENDRCTYTEAHTFVASVANWLAQQGVKPGDRVAIAMRNYPEWMLAYWAITSMGAVVVGMNAWWVAKEMAYALEDASPVVLICDQERLERFQEIKSDFPAMKVVGVRLPDEAPEGVTHWFELVNTEPKMPEANIDPDDDACIFYTSGTTGHPKGARLTHRGCTNNVMNIAFANMVQPMAVARSKGEAGEPAPRGAMSILIATPLFHVTANNCVAHAATLAGGKLVHMYRWDAGEALRIVEAEKITNFSAVPMMTREILMHPDFERRDTSSLKALGGGGAPMQPDLTRKVKSTMPNAAPAQGYGMTETCGIITASAAEFLLDKPESTGRPVPILEAKVVDEAGSSLSSGSVGELWVRGAPVIKGYLNRPDATAEAITDGWLHTGDLAYMDEDQFIYLVDRAKDMVLRGGENVYCAEVEFALFECEGVAECVAFAVPDERLGEEVGAAVYLKPGAAVSAEQLREALRERLSAFKVPRYLWFVDAPLPRNANGKFVKREVKEGLDIAAAG